MPKEQEGKDGGEDGATPNHITETEQCTALEQRQGRKLNEISRKLSLILSAIENLTETLKENQTSARQETSADNSSAITEITNVLTQLSERIPPQTSSQPTTTTSAPIYEDEASKIKTAMSNLWSYKLNKRKEAYWNMVKNQGHRDKYQDWVEREKIIVPRFLQKKEFTNEHEDQKAVRAKAALNDFKAEIELRDLRAKQHEERYKQLDEEMERCLKTKGDERVINSLLQMWRSETNYQESISVKRWQRSAKWLDDYETKFLQEYHDKNSFFKTTDDQAEETRPFARTYSQAVRSEQNNRHPDIQIELQNTPRHTDTPRPKARKQRNPQTSNIPRPAYLQPSNGPRSQYQQPSNILKPISKTPRYQQPPGSQGYSNRERQSRDYLRRPIQPEPYNQNINIELDDDNDYFLDQTSSTETLT